MNGQRTGLGFASGDYFNDYEEYGSGWDDLYFDALDWGFNPGEAAFFADGGYGGGSWWDNFDPLSGDYAGGGSNSPGSNGDLWNDFFYWYLDQGYDPFEAATLADAESSDSIRIDTWEPGILPQIPDDLPGVIPAPYDPYTIPLPELFANDPAPPGPLPPLPGYCPQGYYHPVSDPFKCVPFPDESKPAARKKAQQKAQQQQQQAQKRQQQQQQPCPTGQVRYPYTGKCVPQQCPQGTKRNPATGECVKTQQQGELPRCPDPRLVYDLQKKKCVVPGSSSGSSNSWLWLLLIAGGAVVISKRRS